MGRTRFGPFVLDQDQRRLMCDGGVLPLSPKAYELLVTLVAARPRVLSKADLHSAIWPSTFVSDATLAALVAELRRALDDSPLQPRYIRTAHRYGYAFCGEAADERSLNAPSPARAGRHWIETNDGAQRWYLHDGENVIGRDPAAAVCLDLPTVSRRHAVIARSGAAVVLRDLGSKNGTRVDGAALGDVCALTDGVRVLVGSVPLVYRSLDAPASTVTVE